MEISTDLPTNRAKVGGFVATWVMKTDFKGFRFLLGIGLSSRALCKNLLSCPVGTR